MKTYIEEVTTYKILDSIKCNKCGIEVKPEDFIEYQEFISISISGGTRVRSFSIPRMME
jgi:hypothetical protein